MTVLRAEIDGGGRAYYVVPFIDGDEDEAKSVSATAARLEEGGVARRENRHDARQDGCGGKGSRDA